MPVISLLTVDMSRHYTPKYRLIIRHSTGGRKNEEFVIPLR